MKILVSAAGVREQYFFAVGNPPRFAQRFEGVQTFSIALTSADLIAADDRQYHEKSEARAREPERQRQEIERLHAEKDVETSCCVSTVSFDACGIVFLEPDLSCELNIHPLSNPF
ncbi:MAG: hypothetical protein LBR08_08565 [Bacteroidales bacterium]|nr:hypothetical protein [Bacteroidales bacterium]